MYLSRLKLEPTSRTTRTLYLNHYLLHQAIFRAFPDTADGGPGRVLYRLDVSKKGEVTTYIQSEKQPDWDKARMLDDCLDRTIAQPRAVRQFAPAFTVGQCLRFRLRANPSVKKKAEGKKNGYRLGLLREENQLEWLNKKATIGGFAVLNCMSAPEGAIDDSNKADPQSKLAHYAVLFDGMLKVVDPVLFQQTVSSGIGPAKGFGFGLLSLAAIKD